MKNSCLFCCKPLVGRRSVEHIYPDWLQKRYELSREGVLQTHFSDQGEVLDGRHHRMGQHVCGRVCEPCNNGWMSRLETDVKDLVIELAEGRADFSALTDAQRFVHSRWACKTAFALHAASNYRMIVPRSHFKHLRDDAWILPPGVFVVGHLHSSTEDFAWWQSPNWIMHVSDECDTNDFRQRVRNEAYKITFSIKNLVLLVSHNPFEEMWPVLMEGLHFLLHPPRLPCYMRRKKEFPSDSTHRVCIAVLGAMGLRIAP